jgi:hypothetical protein
MKIRILLIAISLVLLLLVGSHNSSGSSLSYFPTVSGPTRFSSAYTDLRKCGSGMTKKEEKEAEAQGSDIPIRCKGFGGYDVYVYFSACTAEITLEKGQERIHLSSQAVNFKQKIVEWCLANGKPFAVILRVYEYSGDDQCVVGGKITGESLVVKGLKGYEQIDQEVKVKGTPNPNVKAREIADKGYR